METNTTGRDELRQRQPGGIVLRPAVPADASALRAIYAPYVTGTSITFETEVPSAEEFARRIENTTEVYPWLVCEAEGEPAGYAYASVHRQRAAYRWSVDLSVYVAEKHHRRGTGGDRTCRGDTADRRGERNPFRRRRACACRRLM